MRVIGEFHVVFPMYSGRDVVDQACARLPNAREARNMVLESIFSRPKRRYTSFCCCPIPDNAVYQNTSVQSEIVDSSDDENSSEETLSNGAVARDGLGAPSGANDSVDVV